MVYLLGQRLSLHKRVLYALQAVEGVGMATSQRLCDTLLIHKFARVRDLREEQVLRLKELLQPMMEKRRQDRLVKLKHEKLKPQPIQPT